MPEEQERRASKRRISNPAAHPGTPGAHDVASDGSPGQPASDPREPVDFRAAAQRLAARSTYIAQLKADVESGTYRADAEETARAMDRRSDS